MSKFFFEAAAQLPAYLSQILKRVDVCIATEITEIRLRANRPVLLCLPLGEYFVKKNGECIRFQSDDVVICDFQQIQECFLSVCGHSVYAHQESIAQGYITMYGGHRVGIAGSAVIKNNEVTTLKNISSLNIRIARSKTNELPSELQYILQLGMPHILIVGEPCCGKTTLLRSIAAALSQNGLSVCVLDEREEIWPMAPNGQNGNTPLRCDVLSGIKKGIAAIMALRSLAPKVILCDEIGSAEDAYALQQGLNSGVGIIATAHAQTFKELQKRPQIKNLLDNNIFNHVVIMSGRKMPGKIKEVICVAGDN